MSTPTHILACELGYEYPNLQDLLTQFQSSEEFSSLLLF